MLPKFRPITVVETDEFLTATRKLMNDEQRTGLISYLAYRPTAGAVIPGSGGVRKLRWALEGRGKRGGARVIYYYHDVDMPLYMLTAFAKNEREDLARSEINAMRKLVPALVASHRKGRSGS